MTSKVAIFSLLLFAILLPECAHAEEIPPELIKASSYAAARDFPAAIKAVRKILTTFTAKAEVYLRLADFHRYGHSLAAGQAYLQQALLQNPENPGILSGLALIAKYRADPKTCLARSKQALENGARSFELLSLFIETGVDLKENTELARTLRKLKNSAGQEHLFSLGHALWQFRLNRFSKAKNTLAEHLALAPSGLFGKNLLGDIALHLNEYEDAVAAYRTALKENPVSYKTRILLYSGLARSFMLKSTPDSTRFYLDRAGELAGRTGSIAEQLKVQQLRIRLFSQLKLFGPLIDACKAAIELSATLNDISGLTQATIKLGLANQNIGNNVGAIAVFKQALEVASEENQALIRVEMAKSYLEGGRIKKATKSLRLGTNLAEQTRQANLIHRALMMSAEVDRKRGQRAEARNKLRQVLRFAQRTQQHDLTESCFIKLSRLYIDNPVDYNSAEHFLNLADALARQTSQLHFSASHRWMQGRLAGERGEVESAESLFIQATQLGIESGSHLSTLAGQAGLLQTYLDAGFVQRAVMQADTALKYLGLHHASILQKPMAEYFDLKNDLFGPAIHAYANAGDLESIFSVCEKSKALRHLAEIKGIRHLLNSAVADSFNWQLAKIEFQEGREWRGLWRFWASGKVSNPIFSDTIRNQITELQIVKSKLLATIAKQYPQFSTVVSPQEIALAELQKTLTSLDSNLIHYFVTGNATFIILVTPTAIYCKRVNVGREVLEELVHHVRPGFQQNGGAPGPNGKTEKYFRLDQAAQLYDLIFEPIADLIPAGQRLIVSPDDVLAFFPIEALVSNPEDLIDNQDYTNATYLIENHPISYVPSAFFLNTIQKRRRARKEVLSFMSPSDEQSDSHLEAQEVNQWETNLTVTGKLASKNTFTNLASKFQFLRLSLPGIIHSAMPLRSAIGFPGQNGVPDSLRVKGLFNLKLQAEIAILDRMERKSMRSKNIAGSSILHAFSFAGTGALLLGLWHPDHHRVTKLVDDVIENLKTGMDKPTAVQQAKIRYMESNSRNPYYWASLVLSGDPRPAIKGKPQNKAMVYLAFTAAIALLAVLLWVQVKKMRIESDS